MPNTAFHHVRILGIAGVLPEKIINIDDEICFYKNDIRLLERNKKILGLSTRHVADERTTNTDLCESAAKALFDRLDVSPKSVDALIAISSSHEYQYPATACILQGRLGLYEDCCCYDLSGLACSAYVMGLYQAHALISSGASKRCLVVSGDVVSRHSDRRNRNSNMLFGDAGTATLLERCDEDRPAYFRIGTRGTLWDSIVAPAGGAGLPIRSDIASLEFSDPRGNVWHLWDEIMKGMSVFKFSTEVGPKGITAVLADAGMTFNDIDYVAFHQANAQIVKSIASFAKVPEGKFSSEAFSKYGNCGCAAVVTDLLNRLEKQPLERTLLATFGVGLAWGFALVDLSGTVTAGLNIYKTPAGKPDRQQKINYWINYFKQGNQ